MRRLLFEQVLASPQCLEVIPFLVSNPLVYANRPPTFPNSVRLKELYVCSDDRGVRLVSIPNAFMGCPELALGSRLVLRNGQVHIDFDDHIEDAEKWHHWLANREFIDGDEAWSGFFILHVSPSELVALLHGPYIVHKRWRHHFAYLYLTLGCSSIQVQALSNAVGAQVSMFSWAEVLLKFGFQWSEDDLSYLYHGQNSVHLGPNNVVTVSGPLGIRIASKLRPNERHVNLPALTLKKSNSISLEWLTEQLQELIGTHETN